QLRGHHSSRPVAVAINSHAIAACRAAARITRLPRVLWLDAEHLSDSGRLDAGVADAQGYCELIFAHNSAPWKRGQTRVGRLRADSHQRDPLLELIGRAAAGVFQVFAKTGVGKNADSWCTGPKQHARLWYSCAQGPQAVVSSGVARRCAARRRIPRVRGPR